MVDSGTLTLASVILGLALRLVLLDRPAARGI